jgi:hypothetical protein
MFQDRLTIDVDFNDVDRDGLLVASRRFASSPREPFSGERVWVSDDEGLGCEAAVDRVDGMIVYLRLDRSTFKREMVLAALAAVRGAPASTTDAPRARLPELV